MGRARKRIQEQPRCSVVGRPAQMKSKDQSQIAQFLSRMLSDTIPLVAASTAKPASQWQLVSFFCFYVAQLSCLSCAHISTVWKHFNASEASRRSAHRQKWTQTKTVADNRDSPWSERHLQLQLAASQSVNKNPTKSTTSLQAIRPHPMRSQVS